VGDLVDSAPRSDPFEARIGSVLGSWRLTRLIGVGGMAAVYEAGGADGRVAALKILHPEVARHEELRARFAQEARAVERVRHPGVVAIHDLGTTDDGCPFLVMELCAGASLATTMRRRQLTPDGAVVLVEQLLEVLVAAHAASVIHRDLKPDNLFVLPDGSLKVLDFGIARVRAGTVAHVVTKTGTSLGTPHYMPPEQIKGVDVDHRADLFATGAILWEIFTGRDIHETSSSQELLLAMLTRPAPPVLSVAPDVPAPLAQVIDRALAFHAADRYPDAQTMLDDLREARAGRPPPFASAPSARALPTVASTPKAIAAATTPEPTPHPQGATEKGAALQPLLVAIIVAGVAVGALVTWLLLSRGDDTEPEDLFAPRAAEEEREAPRASESVAPATQEKGLPKKGHAKKPKKKR
jgi:serine/threonine protein kinase